MFSRRTPPSLEPSILSQTLARLRERGTAWVDLTVSNPTRAGLPYPAREILDALKDPRCLTYEPLPFGHPEARQAVAEYYERRGLQAPPERIALASSTSEAYSWLFKLLCEPEDEVLTPAPSYPLFECLANLESVRVVQYPLVEEKRWGVDFDALDRLATDRTRALVFVNPNNPTGTFLQPEEYALLQHWASERGVALILDEVFLDYSWGARDLLPCSGLSGNHPALTFVLSGLSKIAALPQMKLGWIVVEGPEQLRKEALERLEWIADSYLPVSAPAQFAAPKWLKAAGGVQEALRQRCEFNLSVLRESMVPETGCQVMPASGGWLAVLDVPRVWSEEAWVLTLAARHGVLVQPGFFYDFPREAFLVVSLLAPEAEFGEGAERLKQAFRSV